MPKELHKILAINPGSRNMGIAVFVGTELKDWRVKVIKGKWSKQKFEKIKLLIRSFIKEYDPDIVVLKKLTCFRSSDNLNDLVRATKQIVKRRNLRLYEYSNKDLKAYYSPDEKINKTRLAQLLAFRYPALWYEFNQEQKHKNPYYRWAFEAIAIGEVCSEQIDQ